MKLGANVTMGIRKESNHETDEDRLLGCYRFGMLIFLIKHFVLKPLMKPTNTEISGVTLLQDI